MSYASLTPKSEEDKKEGKKSATIHDAETGKIAIYYGAADTYVGLAFTTVDLIVDYIKKNSVVRESDTEIGRR